MAQEHYLAEAVYGVGLYFPFPHLYEGPDRPFLVTTDRALIVAVYSTDVALDSNWWGQGNITVLPYIPEGDMPFIIAAVPQAGIYADLFLSGLKMTPAGFRGFMDGDIKEVYILLIDDSHVIQVFRRIDMPPALADTLKNIVSLHLNVHYKYTAETLHTRALTYQRHMDGFIMYRQAIRSNPALIARSSP